MLCSDGARISRTLTNGDFFCYVCTGAGLIAFHMLLLLAVHGDF